MIALGRTELNKMQCDNPDCTEEHNSELYLHSRCHLGAGITVMYDQNTGILHLSCCECDKPIVDIEVGYASH